MDLAPASHEAPQVEPVEPVEVEVQDQDESLLETMPEPPTNQFADFGNQPVDVVEQFAEKESDRYVPVCENIKDEAVQSSGFPDKVEDAIDDAKDAIEKVAKKGMRIFSRGYGKCELFKSREMNELVAWHDVKKSGIVFGSSITVLFLLLAYPVLYLLSNLVLISIIGAILTKVYFKLVSKIKGQEYKDPFEDYLQQKPVIDEKDCAKAMKCVGQALSKAVGSGQHLFLGSNLCQSTKFAFSLYFWTKLSKCFSGLTILILLDTVLFSLPVIYEKNHKIIDKQIEQLDQVLGDLVDKVNGSLPSAYRIKLKGD